MGETRKYSNVGFFNNLLNWKQEFFLLNFFDAAGVKVEKSFKIVSLEKASERAVALLTGLKQKSKAN